MSWWLIGFIAALVVVLLVAALLIGILVEARRIRALAIAASGLVEEIDANAAAIVGAVSGAHDEQSAA